MNLFFLSFNYVNCASYHCDKHVVKMILELTQLLYTCQHMNRPNIKWIEKRNKKYIKKGKTPLIIYKCSHKNHPLAIWVRNSIYNYKFTNILALYLCLEYNKRYNKIHKCQEHLVWLLKHKPPFDKTYEYIIPKGQEERFLACKNLKKNLTPIPLAMPPEYYDDDPVVAYRRYYMFDKKDIVTWNYTEKPKWFEDM